MHGEGYTLFCLPVAILVAPEAAAQKKHDTNSTSAVLACILKWPIGELCSFQQSALYDVLY